MASTKDKVEIAIDWANDANEAASKGELYDPEFKGGLSFFFSIDITANSKSNIDNGNHSDKKIPSVENSFNTGEAKCWRTDGPSTTAPVLMTSRTVDIEKKRQVFSPETLIKIESASKKLGRAPIEKPTAACNDNLAKKIEDMLRKNTIPENPKTVEQITSAIQAPTTRSCCSSIRETNSETSNFEAAYTEHNFLVGLISLDVEPVALPKGQEGAIESAQESENQIGSFSNELRKSDPNGSNKFSPTETKAAAPIVTNAQSLGTVLDDLSKSTSREDKATSAENIKKGLGKLYKSALDTMKDEKPATPLTVTNAKDLEETYVNIHESMSSAQKAASAENLKRILENVRKSRANKPKDTKLVTSSVADQKHLQILVSNLRLNGPKDEKPATPSTPAEKEHLNKLFDNLRLKAPKDDKPATHSPPANKKPIEGLCKLV